MTKEGEVIKQIEDIERQLQALKLSIQGQDGEETKKGANRSSSPIKIGDRVTIKNPSKGQKSKGTVTKVNHLTKFATIETDTTKKKVVRLVKNLRK